MSVRNDKTPVDHRGESLRIRRQRAVAAARRDGVTVRQIAEALGTSERTVRRDWEKARLLLAAALE